MTSKVKSSQQAAAGATILHSAEELLLANGPQGISMAMIAQRSGIAVGTVYNYFKDKEALLRTLQETRRKELLDALTAATTTIEAQPFSVKFDFIVAYLFREDPELERSRVLLQMIAKGLAMSTEPSECLLNAFEKWWIPLVEQGIKEGVLREDIPAHVQVQMLGVVVRRALDGWRAGHFKTEEAINLIRIAYLEGWRKPQA